MSSRNARRRRDRGAPGAASITTRLTLLYAATTFLLLVGLELALGRDRDAVEYRRALESGMEEVTRLCRTVDALLFLARAESPASLFDPVLLDVRSEAEVVGDFFAATAADRGVALVCEGEGQAKVNTGLFRAALANLVGNALKWTPSHGRITVVIGRGDDGSLHVDVSDTGPGIAPDQLPRIFDRFYRTGSLGAGNAVGAGLGLAIVKAIMVRQGGSVEVESRPAGGATFSLRFPSPGGPEAP